MHGRGCSKRHTVGCTDDLSVASGADSLEPSLTHSPTPTPGSRTRRTGLLTVMERPPGKQMTLLLCELAKCTTVSTLDHPFQCMLARLSNKTKTKTNKQLNQMEQNLFKHPPTTLNCTISLCLIQIHPFAVFGGEQINTFSFCSLHILLITSILFNEILHKIL